MGIKRFEDVIAWQKAQDLAYAIYLEYRGLKDYSFKDQIRRAVVSISNNISEGFDSSTNKEFIRFLGYASASNSEVRSMLYLSLRLNYLTESKANNLIKLTNELSKLIYSLRKSMM